VQEYKAKDHFEGALPQEIVNPGTLIKVNIYFVLIFLEVFIKQVCFYYHWVQGTCREVTQANCVESLLKSSYICITQSTITELRQPDPIFPNLEVEHVYNLS